MVKWLEDKPGFRWEEVLPGILFLLLYAGVILAAILSLFYPGSER